jgi:hypothetical protein
MLVAGNAGTQIVRNNSTATSEDSLAIAFWLGDTLGQPTPIDTTGADSAWIVTYYPGGDTAFSDEIRLARVEPGIRLSVPVPGGGVRGVQYRRKVSDIDGTGVNGVYSWVIYARDSSLKLWSPFRGTFQVYTSTTHTFATNQDSGGTWVSGVKAAAITADAIATGAIGVDEWAAEADNNGINWGDVSNPTTTVGLTGTTVGIVSTANYIGAAGIQASSFQTAAITADAIATGAIGVDEWAAEADNNGINWGDVSNPTTTVGLTGTTVGTVTTTTTATTATNVTTISAGGITSGSFASGAIDATAIATGAIGVDEWAAEADNNGVNWGDVSNPTTTVGLTGTTVGTVTTTGTASTVTALSNGALDLANDVTGVLADANVATIGVDVTSISTDATAADNAELFFDGTGYSDADNKVTLATGTQTFNMTGNITGNLSGSVGSVAGLGDTVRDVLGDTINAVSGAVALTPAAIDLIWDEDSTGHLVAGTMASSASQTAAGTTPPTVGEIADAVWDEDSTGHYTSPNMAFVASQTAAAGAVSDADAGKIADSVAKHSANASLPDSTMGGILREIHDSLDTQTWAATGSSGSGLQTLSVTVLDTSGTDAVVPSVNVTVQNLAQSANLWWGDAAATGIASGNNDVSTAICLVGYLPGYIFPLFKDTTGSGTTFSDTLRGYNVDVGSPGSANLKRVYAYEYNGVDTLQGLLVVATLMNPPATGDSVVVDTSTGVQYSAGMKISGRTGSDGKWTLDLPLNSNISPFGNRWKLTCYNDDGSTRWDVTVNLTTVTTECLPKITGQLSACP